MISNTDPRIMQQMLKLQLYDGQQLSVGGASNPGWFDVLLLQAQEKALVSSTENHPQPIGDLQKLSPFGSHPALQQASTYEPIIAQASARYHIDPAWIKAIIQVESGFNPLAESSAGAKGLMQLMDGTARSVGVTDSFDPVQNIEGGTRYLAQLLDSFAGEMTVALAAYNAGPGRLSRLGISDEQSLQQNFMKLPAETRNYVAKVLDQRQAFSI